MKRLLILALVAEASAAFNATINTFNHNTWGWDLIGYSWILSIVPLMIKDAPTHSTGPKSTTSYRSPVVGPRGAKHLEHRRSQVPL